MEILKAPVRALEALGVDCLPLVWFEAEQLKWGAAGQQGDLVGPCQARHPQTYTMWQPLDLESTDLGLNPNY